MDHPSKSKPSFQGAFGPNPLQGGSGTASQTATGSRTAEMRDELLALLEDGPHSLAELAGWLEVPEAAIAEACDQHGFPACQRCQRRFIRKPNRAGLTCSRACYERKPPPIIYGRNPEAFTETHRSAPPDPQFGPELRQPHERPSSAKVRTDTPSWWVGVDREAFNAGIAAREQRMRGAKENRLVPMRTLGGDGLTRSGGR